MYQQQKYSIEEESGDKLSKSSSEVNSQPSNDVPESGIHKTDYIELTIEDVAVDTVIEIREYMKENGIQEKRTMYGHDLFRWLMKNV